MKKIIIALFSYIICTNLYATMLQSNVNNIINKIDPSINMSMSVIDLNTGEQLFQRNADRSLIPASNMKLFSEAAALLALGPDYRFQRQLTTDATTLDSGVLNGSLYLSLPGDPSFDNTHLKNLLSTLSKWGIKQIKGNVVIVSASSSIDPYPPGRDPRDVTRSYGAPITPIIIDENRLSIIVNPGQKAGDTAITEVSAPGNVITVHNNITTSSKPNLSAISYKLDMNNQLTLSGAIGNETWAFEKNIAIRNPLAYIKNLIKHHLFTQHIVLDGDVIEGRKAGANFVLATQRSRPLNQLMADTLKPSDNVFADSIFIHTASIINGSPVNWLQANTVMTQFLQQQTGINLAQAVLVDGSGLSKQDRISAQQTVELLRYIYTHFPITYEFIAALPIAGRDGTLQRRFSAATQQGRIRAKTGTMTGIMSLSGYLSAANGHTLAFAIYINRAPNTPSDVAGKYHWLVDQLCSYFLQQRPNGRPNNTPLNANSTIAFQKQPSAANRLRSKQAQWRGLEMSLRKALKNQMVAVVYKQNEFILQDNNHDSSQVWSALAKMSGRYGFSVAVESQIAPQISRSTLNVLWIKNTNAKNSATRTWVLRKNVT